MSNNVTDDLNKVMTDAVLRLKALVDSDLAGRSDFLAIVSLFLTGIVSTTADLVELQSPGGSLAVFADVEASAKAGGFRAVRSMQSPDGMGRFSVSGIREDDMTAAMNYLGQELSTALFKAIHELPMGLRKPETLVRGVEALLSTVLSQRFENPHAVLDSFTEHVHLVLDDLEMRRSARNH